MSTPDRHGRLATVLLLIVTAAWGSTFFLIKDLVVTVPPTDFLAVRFTIAAVAMFALFHRQVRRLTPRDLRLGLRHDRRLLHVGSATAAVSAAGLWRLVVFERR